SFSLFSLFFIFLLFFISYRFILCSLLGWVLLFPHTLRSSFMRLGKLENRPMELLMHFGVGLGLTFFLRLLSSIAAFALRIWFVAVITGYGPGRRETAPV